MDLTGKKIVVLGGSSGIGLAAAEAAARMGGAVSIVSSRQDKVDAACATLPDGATGSVVDLADPVAIDAFFAAFGPLDHLVYTAGDPLRLGAIAATDLADARRAFEVRFWGAFAAAKFASPNIRPGGSIVFTSGLAGHRPRTGWTVGASICTAMEGLTRALAVELAPIRVNLVCPGMVKTPLWAGMTPEAREALYQQAAARLPVGHAGEAEEVAQAYIYLMCQSYATGKVLVVDGGAELV